MVNVKKPQNTFLGFTQLRSMNKRHTAMANWGLSHMKFENKRAILDVGCGGGKNVQRMLRTAPDARVYGVDYSEASVSMTKKLNGKDVECGRLQVVCGKVENLPFEDGSFDLVTAFETVYFWDLDKGCAEVFRTLKDKGEFMIVNEAQSGEGMEDYMENIGFCVYTAEELKSALSAAGFCKIDVCLHENGNWVTLLAKKENA